MNKVILIVIVIMINISVMLMEKVIISVNFVRVQGLLPWEINSLVVLVKKFITIDKKICLYKRRNCSRYYYESSIF
jgi:hypothetical protein